MQIDVGYCVAPHTIALTEILHWFLSVWRPEVQDWDSAFPGVWWFGIHRGPASWSIHIFWLCPHMVAGTRQLSGAPYKPPNLFLESSTLVANHLPKTPTPEYHDSGGYKFIIWTLRRHKHSIHNKYFSSFLAACYRHNQVLIDLSILTLIEN